MTTDESIKYVKKIYWVLCASIIAMVLNVYALRRNGQINISVDEQMEYMLQIICYLTLIGLAPLAYYLHTKRLRQIKGTSDYKLQYRNSLIRKLVLIYSTSIIASICLLISGDNQFLMITAMGFVLLLLNRPSQGRMERELEQS